MAIVILLARQAVSACRRSGTPKARTCVAGVILRPFADAADHAMRQPIDG
jgi:hypothetical protein